MPRTPQPAGFEDPVDRRMQEIMSTAYSDEEFMSQTRDALAELERGGRGVPLRQLQAEERAAGQRGV
jgi:hypothetical protein